MTANDYGNTGASAGAGAGASGVKGAASGEEADWAEAAALGVKAKEPLSLPAPLTLMPTAMLG